MKKTILILSAGLFFVACNNAGDTGNLSSDSMMYKDNTEITIPADTVNSQIDTTTIDTASYERRGSQGKISEPD